MSVPANVPIELPGHQVDPTSALQPMWSSVDFTTEEGLDLLIKIRNEELFGAAELMNVPVLIRHVICHVSDRLDQDSGEVEHWVRTVIVGPQGELAAFGSRGVWQSIGLLVLRYGKPPWDPPLRLVLRQRPLADGKHWYYLALAKEK